MRSVTQSTRPESTPGGAAQRAFAAELLMKVHEQHRTIDWLETNEAEKFDHPFVRALVYGALRYHFSIHTQVIHKLKKPLKARDKVLLYLLYVGTYQLTKLETKRHAAIYETVAACDIVGKGWAKGLVNAILRKVSTEQDTERSFELPSWLEDKLDCAYKTDSAALKQALLARAPMILRVNQSRVSPADYQNLLKQADIRFKTTSLNQALHVDPPVPMRSLPGWASGQVAVQDLGAQWVAQLLLDQLSQTSPATAELRLLDACAAPGGKLFALLENAEQQGLKVVADALEKQPRRMEVMQQFAAQFGHQANWVIGDASSQDWWSGEPYHAILMDAPCSGTGTIRRHPDSKIHLSEDGIAQAANLQHAMLRNMWHMLAPGGTLLYCTCSILQEENDAIVADWLSQTIATDMQDDVLVKIELPHGQGTDLGWQMLPTEPLTDGFYLSLLRKPGRVAR